MESLSSRKEDLQKERLRALQSKRNDLSLINNLPYDIVSVIFILALSLTGHMYFCGRLRGPPVRISLPPGFRYCWVPFAPRGPDASRPRSRSCGRHFRFFRSGLARQANLHRMAFLCLNLPCQIIRRFFSKNSDVPQALRLLDEVHFHCSVSVARGVCTGPHDFVLSVDPPTPHKVHVTSTSLSNIKLRDAVRHLSPCDPGASSRAALKKPPPVRSRLHLLPSPTEPTHLAEGDPKFHYSVAFIPHVRKNPRQRYAAASRTAQAVAIGPGPDQPFAFFPPAVRVPIDVHVLETHGV